MGDRTWYMKLGARMEEPTGTVQLSEQMRRSNNWRLPEHVLRLAQAEYQHQYGNGQDYETMQARLGLSITEVIALLADLAERHGAKPTKPRRAPGSDREEPTP